jgi:lipopolysaccharide/colanic/teichoic acid biosynthesis glycosyltransferase
MDLGGPVLYRQRRPGRDERPFDILKFRTMRAGGGPDRLRLTRLGRWLRRTSLDELPQLVNIIRGEMSCIGPRPLLERYLSCYSDRERRRHSIRPGLTGWAQTHGRNGVSWRERLEMDVWYVEHASWLLDARIALRTVHRLLSGEGVAEDPSSLMPDLDVERQRA